MNSVAAATAFEIVSLDAGVQPAGASSLSPPVTCDEGTQSGSRLGQPEQERKRQDWEKVSLFPITSGHYHVLAESDNPATGRRVTAPTAMAWQRECFRGVCSSRA